MNQQHSLKVVGLHPPDRPGEIGGGETVCTDPQPEKQTVTASRLRIWQVDPGMLCSVLGTCLTLNDLHVIARRARYRIEPTTAAYQLHSWFVEMVTNPNDLSKIVDKELERRHARSASIVRRARTPEELQARFQEVCASGHIAGAYWGAMSHPLCTGTQRWRLFGEIHMLSHLVGASRQADLARLHVLEGSCAALDGKLAQLTHDHRALQKQQRLEEEQKERSRRTLALAELRLAAAQQRIVELESQTLIDEMRQQQGTLEQLLATANERLLRMEQTLSQTRSDLAESRRAEAQACELALDLSLENEALERELLCRVTPCPLKDPAALAHQADLTGKRILCVGGRSSLVQHYRALVERRGGAFLHHDGGLEESLDAVTRALSTIDAVVCPVDCVSHAAYWKVKRACKHLAKQLIVLRSSGLSSFALGLQTVGQVTMKEVSARVISVVDAKQ